MVDKTKTVEEESRYCITMSVQEIDVLITLPADKQFLDLINENRQFSWIFGNGIQIIVDKNHLKHFSIELMQ